MTLPDVWLRGPVPDIDPLLQPVAHSLLQAMEDVERATADLPDEALWRKPGKAASIGFHLKHLAGSTDRLLTYARGESLSDEQRARLTAEPHDDPAVTVEVLVERIRKVIDAGLAQLKSTPGSTLTEPRAIGRTQLPSTVLGCLVHAGEHAYRHAGQLITTVRLR